jgi:hypothetical protein
MEGVFAFLSRGVGNGAVGQAVRRMRRADGGARTGVPTCSRGSLFGELIWIAVLGVLLLGKRAGRRVEWQPRSELWVRRRPP